MEESNPKITKLESKSGRPVPANEQDLPEEIRYIAYPYPEHFRHIEDDSIDLLELWIIFKRNKLLILSVILLCTGAAIASAYSTNPVFRADLTMIAANQEENSKLAALSGQFGGLASLAGVSVNSNSGGLEKTLAILKSRAFLVPFLKEENIIERLDSEKSDWSMLGLTIRKSNHKTTTLGAYEYFVKRVLDVDKDIKTGMVNLSIEWVDPQSAATWANKLVAMLNEHQREAAILEAKQNIEYLNHQLEETGIVDMEQAIYRLIESQTKIMMLANVNKEYAMQVIDPAVVAEEPVPTKRRLIIIMGVITGLILGLFLALLVNFFKRVNVQAKSMDNR